MFPSKPILPTLNKRHPLAQGLICYYPMYEGIGNVCYDAVNGDAMVLHGSPLWVPSAIGSSLYFDGTNTQYGVAPENRFPMADSDRTIGAIYNLSSLPSRAHYTLCWYGDRWMSLGFGIFGNGTLSPTGNIGVSQYGGASQTTYSVNDGTWRSVLGTAKNTGSGVCDGSVVETATTVTSSMSFTTAPHAGFIVGGESPPPGEGYQGYIAAMFVWNRVLSDYDIQTHLMDPFGVVRPSVREFFSGLIFPPVVSASIVPQASYYYSMMSRA